MTSSAHLVTVSSQTQATSKGFVMGSAARWLQGKLLRGLAVKLHFAMRRLPMHRQEVDSSW